MLILYHQFQRKEGGGVQYVLATQKHNRKVQRIVSRDDPDTAHLVHPASRRGQPMLSSFDRGVFEYDGRKKVVVFGSRSFSDFKLMAEKLDNYLFFLDRPIILSGGQKTWDPGEGVWIGADHLAEKYATRRLLLLRIFHADWEEHGKKAGPIRNGEMAKEADFGVAFWDGKSAGTKNMIERMKKKGKPVKIVYYLKKKKVKKVKKKKKDEISLEDFLRT